MRRKDTTTEDRAQAFTLEGFISAVVILTAVLFALQAVVITPTTGGAVDRAAQEQEQRQLQDILLIAGESGELSELVRNWNPDPDEGDVGWEGSSERRDAAYNNSDFAELSYFGYMMDEQFVNSSAKAYKVEFIALDDSGTRHTEQIVKMGGGNGDSVVSASYFVTVYEDQRLTEPKADRGDFDEKSETVEDAWDDYSGDQQYPFPIHDSRDTVYSVIEVRVTVW